MSEINRDFREILDYESEEEYERRRRRAEANPGIAEETKEEPEAVIEEEAKEEIKAEIKAEIEEEVKEEIEAIKEESEVGEFEPEHDLEYADIDMKEKSGQLLANERELKAWGQWFYWLMEKNGLDLDNPDCLSCFAFQKEKDIISFDGSITNHDLADKENFARYVLGHLEQGCDVRFFLPGETTPHSIGYNKNGYPVADFEHEEIKSEPQKLSRWVRFANWITRGKAYHAEVEAYEKSVAEYQENLAFWENGREYEVAMRDYRKEKLEKSAEKENRYVESIKAEKERQAFLEIERKINEGLDKFKQQEKEIDEIFSRIKENGERAVDVLDDYEAMKKAIEQKKLPSEEEIAAALEQSPEDSSFVDAALARAKIAAEQQARADAYKAEQEKEAAQESMKESIEESVKESVKKSVEVSVDEIEASAPQKSIQLTPEEEERKKLQEQRISRVMVEVVKATDEQVIQMRDAGLDTDALVKSRAEELAVECRSGNYEKIAPQISYTILTNLNQWLSRSPFEPEARQTASVLSDITYMLVYDKKFYDTISLPEQAKNELVMAQYCYDISLAMDELTTNIANPTDTDKFVRAVDGALGMRDFCDRLSAIHGDFNQEYVVLSNRDKYIASCWDRPIVQERRRVLGEMESMKEVQETMLQHLAEPYFEPAQKRAYELPPLSTVKQRAAAKEEVSLDTMSGQGTGKVETDKQPKWEARKEAEKTTYNPVKK